MEILKASIELFLTLLNDPQFYLPLMLLIWFCHSWGGFFHTSVLVCFSETELSLSWLVGEWKEGSGGGSKSFSIPLWVDKCMSLENWC